MSLAIGGAASAGSLPSSPSGRTELMELGRAGFRALLAIVPRVVWSGFVSSVRGFFAFGFTGLALVGVLLLFSFAFSFELPTWLWVVHIICSPLIFGIAGAYIGALRGLLRRLATEIAERGLMTYLYAIVRPTILGIAAKLQHRTGRLTRHELIQELRSGVRARLERIVDEQGNPPGWIDRVQRWVGFRLQLVLTLAALPALRSPERSEVVEDLESMTLDRLESGVAGSLLGLFDSQVVLATALALLLSSLPVAIYALL